MSTLQDRLDAIVREREQWATGEDNDCSVVTLAVVGGISYAEAHQILKDGGRQDKQGMERKDWLAAVQAAGFDVVPHKTLGLLSQVAPLLAKLPEGKFAIGSPGHVRAMIDGAIVDGGEPTDDIVMDVIEFKGRHHDR